MIELLSLIGNYLSGHDLVVVAILTFLGVLAVEGVRWIIAQGQTEQVEEQSLVTGLRDDIRGLKEEVKELRIQVKGLTEQVNTERAASLEFQRKAMLLEVENQALIADIAARAKVEQAIKSGQDAAKASAAAEGHTYSVTEVQNS